jgi:hypothetical protein
MRTTIACALVCAACSGDKSEPSLGAEDLFPKMMVNRVQSSEGTPAETDPPKAMTDTGGRSKANGETCAVSDDCASDFCAIDAYGEPRCFGNGEANAPCSDAYDCSEGICLLADPERNLFVCSPGLTVCDEIEIFADCIVPAVEWCQLAVFCDELATAGFDACVQESCQAFAERGSPSSCAALQERLEAFDCSIFESP